VAMHRTESRHRTGYKANPINRELTCVPASYVTCQRAYHLLQPPAAFPAQRPALHLRPSREFAVQPHRPGPNTPARMATTPRFLPAPGLTRNFPKMAIDWTEV